MEGVQRLSSLLSMWGLSPMVPFLAGAGKNRAPVQGLEGRVQGCNKGWEGLPRPPVRVPALFQFCVLRSLSTCLGEMVTGEKV